MKRDMDLIRTLILRMEDFPSPGLIDMPLTVPGHDDEEVMYHFHLMGEAGLIQVVDLTRRAVPSARPFCLKWAGHEFAAAARNETLWNKTKGKAKAALGSLGAAGFGVLLDMLKDGAKEMLKAAH